MGSALVAGLVELSREQINTWGGVLTVTGFTALIALGWYVSHRIREWDR